MPAGRDLLTCVPEDILRKISEYLSIVSIAKSKMMASHSALRSAMSARVYERNGGTLFEMGLARFLGHECQHINRSVGKSMILAAAKYSESNGGSCSIARAFCALKGWAGSEGEKEQAIRCLYSCAQGATKYGNGTAEFLLGDAYHYGEGVQRDYAKAAKFYGCAADKGHGGGCHMLAVMYEKGRGGLERSLRIATVLYEKAVATGHCVSRYNLANILADSCIHRAVKLYSESAAQGHIDAKYNLGLIRYGSQQEEAEESAATLLAQSFVNHECAFKLFLDASLRGHLDAQWMLARCYESGIGTQRDESEALKLFQLVANHDDVDAQCKLGEIYEEGLLGVEKDDAVALEWYRRAAALGDDEAEEGVSRLM